MIKHVFIGGAALTFVACTTAEPVQTGTLAPEVTATEAHGLMEERGVILIDVRRPAEWADSGVAASAHRVTLQDPEFLSKVLSIVGEDTSAEVAFICRSGRRSAAARDQLVAAGYANATSVAGGTLQAGGWVESGLPVEQVSADCPTGDATATC